MGGRGRHGGQHQRVALAGRFCGWIGRVIFSPTDLSQIWMQNGGGGNGCGSEELPLDSRSARPMAGRGPRGHRLLLLPLNAGLAECSSRIFHWFVSFIQGYRTTSRTPSSPAQEPCEVGWAEGGLAQGSSFCAVQLELALPTTTTTSKCKTSQQSGGLCGQLPDSLLAGSVSSQGTSVPAPPSPPAPHSPHTHSRAWIRWTFPPKQGPPTPPTPQEDQSWDKARRGLGRRKERGGLKHTAEAVVLVTL